MPQHKPFFFQVAVKDFKAADQSGADGKKVVKISGLASTPTIDRYRDIVEPEAFAKAIDKYMTNPVLLRSHDSDRPAGLVSKAGISGDGLSIDAEVMDPQTQEEVMDGRMRALSIGYIPLFTVFKWLQDDGTLRDFNAETDSWWSPKAIRVIKELDLVEISIVSTPANPDALFTLAKSLKAAREAISAKDISGMLTGEAGTKETSTEGAEAAGADASTETDAAAKGAEAADQDAESTGAEAGTGSDADAAAGEAGTGDTAASAGTSETTDASESSTDAAKDAETEAKDDEETDADETTDTEDAGAGIAPKPEDEAEKADETAAAGSTEQDAETQDEGKNAGAGESGEGKRAVALPADAVEASKAIEPILKQLGIVAETDSEGKAVTLPAEVKDLVVGLLQHVVRLNAALDESEAKLAKVPQKRALAPAAQLGDAKAGDAKHEPGALFKFLGIPTGNAKNGGK